VDIMLGTVNDHVKNKLLPAAIAANAGQRQMCPVPNVLIFCMIE
jgi:hypothetical protein